MNRTDRPPVQTKTPSMPAIEKEWNRALADLLTQVDFGTVVRLRDIGERWVIYQVKSLSEPVSITEGRRIIPIAEQERKAILRAVRLMDGNVVAAAKSLGISKTKLYNKLKQYGVIPPSVSSSPAADEVSA